MTTSLASSLSEFVFFALVVAGCSAPSGGGLAPAPQLALANATDVELEADGGPSARRPDGVILEVPMAVPPARARTAGGGVLTLREPASDTEVARLVVAFFEAWQRQSLDTLMGFLTRDAGPLGARAGGRAALAEEFRQRLQAHDYGRLAGTTLVRAEHIERWTWDELDAPHGPVRPPEMQPGELLIIVPIEVTHRGGERLFGDLARLILRRDAGELRIASYGELDP